MISIIIIIIYIDRSRRLISMREGSRMMLTRFDILPYCLPDMSIDKQATTKHE